MPQETLFDKIANLPFLWVLAIAVGLYALRALFYRWTRLPEKTRDTLFHFVDDLFFAWVFIFLFLRPFVVQSFYIPSGSMLPTLEIRDRLMVARFPYWIKGPSRGDIVVFKAPPNASAMGREQDYIKRLIGLPGEKLAVTGGRVYINGKPLEEAYTMERSASDFGPIVIPDDHYFMMGDNRNDSADSRYWGPLHKHRIIGRAWVIFWPLGKIGLVRTPEYDVAAQPQPRLGLPFLMRGLRFTQADGAAAARDTVPD